MKIKAVHYAASFFKFKTPKPIQVIPTNQTLKWLNAELKENANIVKIYLGGDDHSYLKLSLSDLEYTLVTPNN